MCQIIYAPNKKLLIMEDLEKSQANNPDGFGIAFAQNGRLAYCKKMADYKIFLDALKLVPDDVPLVIHFRYTTHGETSKMNIHPFQILSEKQGDPIDLCMAHNGSVNSIHTYGEKKSDTLLYVEKILRPILKEAPHLIFNPGFNLLVQRDIGTGHNKFIFFNGKGEVAWVNKTQGHVPKGCEELWYANSYSLTDSYRSSKGKGYTSQEERWQRQFPHLWRSMGGNGVRSQAGQPASDGRGNSGTGVLGDVKAWHQQQRRQGVLNAHSDKRSELGGHPDSPYYNFSEVEKDLPDNIKALLKEGEELLVNKFIDKVSLQGWGWVKYGHNSARWEKHIMHNHKKWKLTTDPRLRAELGVDLPGDKLRDASEIRCISEPSIASTLALAEEERQLKIDFERKYDERNFRLLNEAETLDWVMSFPDEAAQWATKNGFYGSPLKIAEFINDAKDGADFVSDFIFRSVRRLHGVKTLDDYIEAQENKKAG